MSRNAPAASKVPPTARTADDQDEDEVDPAGQDNALIANNTTLQAIQGAMATMTQALQAATAMGQAATNAANAATAAINPPIAPAGDPADGPAAGGGAPGTFLLTPLSSGITNIINYPSKQGRKQYELATKSLFATIEKFNVEHNQFQMFINLQHIRAKEFGILDAGGNAMVPPDLMRI
jgi:hypothetical protein